jgi:hypothetical protein
VAPLTFLLATHFLSLQYLPAIGAGASVRLTRLRSRVDLDFFHFLAPINWKTNEGCSQQSKKKNMVLVDYIWIFF